MLIYCSSAADVMQIRDALTDEEASELQKLGTLVEQKWLKGKRGEADPNEVADPQDDFVMSKLIEEVLPPAQAYNVEMALGVKAWKANQAHRLPLLLIADAGMSTFWPVELCAVKVSFDFSMCSVSSN